MKLTKLPIMLLIMSAASFDVLAEKIYKTTDESGAAVFSDTKTPDAEKIKVQPNVIGVRVPDMPEPTVKEKSKKQASTQKKEPPQQVGGGGVSGQNLRRKIQNVTNGEGLKGRPANLPARKPGNAPVNLPVQRPAARPGGR